jgi:hypothetical protein
MERWRARDRRGDRHEDMNDEGHGLGYFCVFFKFAVQNLRLLEGCSALA